jgi:hypothetical protein
MTGPPCALSNQLTPPDAPALAGRRRRLADDEIRWRGVRSQPTDTPVAGHLPLQRLPPSNGIALDNVRALRQVSAHVAKPLELAELIAAIADVTGHSKS